MRPAYAERRRLLVARRSDDLPREVQPGAAAHLERRPQAAGSTQSYSTPYPPQSRRPRAANRPNDPAAPSGKAPDSPFGTPSRQRPPGPAIRRASRGSRSGAPWRGATGGRGPFSPSSHAGSDGGWPSQSRASAGWSERGGNRRGAARAAARLAAALANEGRRRLLRRLQHGSGCASRSSCHRGAAAFRLQPRHRQPYALERRGETHRPRLRLRVQASPPPPPRTSRPAARLAADAPAAQEGAGGEDDRARAASTSAVVHPSHQAPPASRSSRRRRDDSSDDAVGVEEQIVDGALDDAQVG